MAIDAEQLAKRLYAVGMATEDEPLVGCSEADIEKIENHFRVKLPAAYVQFMRTMGRDTARFMTHFTVTYPYIIKTQTEVSDWLDDTDFEFPDTAFAFLTADGDFLFFDTESGAADPPIYRAQVMDDVPGKVAESFSEFLGEQADLEIEAFDRVFYEKQSADHHADPHIQKRDSMIKIAPFQVGDRVRLTDDIEEVKTNLGDGARADFASGQKGVVYSVYWNAAEAEEEDDDGYGYWVEFSNEADTELIGLVLLSTNLIERAT